MKFLIDEITKVSFGSSCGLTQLKVDLVWKISNRTKTDSGTWAENAKACG